MHLCVCICVRICKVFFSLLVPVQSWTAIRFRLASIRKEAQGISSTQNSERTSKQVSESVPIMMAMDILNNNHNSVEHRHRHQHVGGGGSGNSDDENRLASRISSAAGIVTKAIADLERVVSATAKSGSTAAATSQHDKRQAGMSIATQRIVLNRALTSLAAVPHDLAGFEIGGRAKLFESSFSRRLI